MKRDSTPLSLLHLQGTKVRLRIEEGDGQPQVNVITKDALKQNPPIDLSDRTNRTLAALAPLIQQGLLLSAVAGEFPIIARQLDGTPIYQGVYSPPSLKPLFEQGLLVPAAPSEFPVIAYQLDGAPVYQGKDERGHIWWDIDCDCKDCKQDRLYATDDDEEEVVYPISSQQALQQRYEAGDPEVGLLGEPQANLCLVHYLSSISTSYSPSLSFSLSKLLPFLFIFLISGPIYCLL